jgi:hypothetical protein
MHQRHFCKKINIVLPPVILCHIRSQSVTSISRNAVLLGITAGIEVEDEVTENMLFIVLIRLRSSTHA